MTSTTPTLTYKYLKNIKNNKKKIQYIKKIRNFTLNLLQPFSPPQVLSPPPANSYLHPSLHHWTMILLWLSTTTHVCPSPPNNDLAVASKGLSRFSRMRSPLLVPSFSSPNSHLGLSNLHTIMNTKIAQLKVQL